ncbi:hypothetical protein BASA81_016879 [Batrachochytrium salamandrivorans]|nr:hypothetical protein BASA81_016879 [Batrachochytrium salamandrivorans]
MDAELATRLNIPLVKIPVPIKLRLADGDSSSMITHRTLPLQLHIGRHVKTIGFYVTSLCHGIILGYSWLERHNPQVNWESRMVDFGSSYCLENCCVGSTRIQGLGKPPRTSDISPKPSIPKPEISDQTSDSAADSDIDASLFKDPSMDLDLGIKKPLLQKTSNTSKSVSFAETIQTEADILPSHRSFDCTINLSSSTEPSYGKIYQLTREEDKVMQEWIQDNLAKGFIRNSSSPYGAPCFFVKQKDKLHLCMDYRGLNKQTIKDRNPIPLISEMLRTLSTGKIFTTLDLRGAYNLLRIKEGDEPKTAFITKYGQFEFLTEIKYLGYIIRQTGLQWIHQRFLLSRIGQLPKKLLRRTFRFLGTRARSLVQKLKDAFAQPGFLAHPNDEQPFILETDASDFAISGVLHQHDQTNTLRPVAFYSRQMNNAERNYDIYDKELFGGSRIFQALETTCCKVDSSSDCPCAITRTWKFYVDQETNSSTGSLVP